MSVSSGDEYLSLSLSNNNIGLVHLKTLGLNEDVTREVKFDLVCRGFHSGAIDSIDIAIQRPIIVTCSKADSTIRLWNYQTHQCVLAREYYVLEDMAIREAARPLKSVAIHPSGYYLAASFIDKIRLYHILHDELRHYRSLEIKSSNLMRFNSGGNFLFIVDQKNVLIYNAYTLVKLHQIRCTSESVTDIVFGDRDSSFALITPDGFLGRYRMPSFQIIKERQPGNIVSTEPGASQRQALQEDKGPVLAYRSCDFIGMGGLIAADGTEETMFVTAGDAITVLNSKDLPKQGYQPLIMPIMNHHTSHNSSSGSVAEDSTPVRYNQIRYVKNTSI